MASPKRQAVSTKTLDGPAIGKRIARARKEAGGMTGRELAEFLDVSERSLRDYESGGTIPWKHFARLEQLTGRSTEWFLYGREPRDPAAERHREVMAELRRIGRELAELRKTAHPQTRTRPRRLQARQ